MSSTVLKSNYNTLKFVLFIMLNTHHNSMCKEQLRNTVLKSIYVIFNNYRTLKCMLL